MYTYCKKDVSFSVFKSIFHVLTLFYPHPWVGGRGWGRVPPHPHPWVRGGDGRDPLLLKLPLLLGRTSRTHVTRYKH